MVKSIKQKEHLERLAKKQIGINHPNWKGKSHDKGYVLIRNKTHHRTREGYVYEHILIAEEKIGRRLKNNEVVHHINCIKDDNRKENLKVLLVGQHKGLHNTLRAKPLKIKCIICKKEFKLFLSQLKSGRKCCSRKCANKLISKKLKGRTISWKDKISKTLKERGNKK